MHTFDEKWRRVCRQRNKWNERWKWEEKIERENAKAICTLKWAEQSRNWTVELEYENEKGKENWKWWNEKLKC